MQPKVTLLSHTPNPVAVVFSLWEASKAEGKLLSVEDVRANPDIRTSDKERLTPEELFWNVLRQRIPIGEHINFVFVLEGVSVSLREQMVRHRIGTRVGDNIGVDIIPDLANSSWWSQSMRIQDMGQFADAGMYRVPESLKGKHVPNSGPFPEGVAEFAGCSAEEVFKEHMERTQDVYNALHMAQVPMEDAREVIPLGAQHRISWALNLGSLLHILGKRGCWILQLGIWGPIIRGIVEELATKVHPSFRQLVAPPCIGADGKFAACVYREENRRRMTGDDKLPSCPLYLCRDEDGVSRTFLEHFRPEGRPLLLRDSECDVRSNNAIPRRAEMVERAEEYRALWGHDPYLWDIQAAE